MTDTQFVDGVVDEVAVAEGFGPPAGRPSDTVPPGEFRFRGHRGGLHAVVAMVCVGIAFDAALRNDMWSVSGALWLVAGAVAVATSPGLPRQRRLALVAVPFAACLTWRASGWLLWPDLLVAMGVIVWAATPVAPGLVGLLRRGEALAWSFFSAPVAVAHLCAGPFHHVRRHRSLGSVALGLVIAAPIVLVLGALLAAGDAFFASWLSLDVSAEPALAHLVVMSIGAAGIAILLAPRPATTLPDRLPSARLGDIEITVVLGAVALLFGSWATAQVVAATGGRDTVLQTSGLTFAEWARSGFFQLLWVAALTLALLASLTRWARGEQLGRTRLVLSLAVAALTLTMVVVSLVKLDLYADTFGLTMLRLYVTVFAWWLGGLFVLVAVALVSRRVRSVAVRVAVVSAMSGVFAMNVANPEAIVVETNLERAQRGQGFDVAYLDRLGADGLVHVAGMIDDLDGTLRTETLGRLCMSRDERQFDDLDARGAWVADRRGGDGVLGWNRASRQLGAERARLC